MACDPHSLPTGARFFRDLPAGAFYGFNREGAAVQKEQTRMVTAGLDRRRKSQIRPHRGLCDTDQTDLRSISVPTLVLHGEDAQMVPMADAARKSIKLLRNSITKTYPAICGMLTINADALNADFLPFIQV